MTSGLYEDLTRRGLLISHRETTESPPELEASYKVIRPDPAAFLSSYTESLFEAVMHERFEIVRKEKIPDGSRTIYLMKNRAVLGPDK